MITSGLLRIHIPRTKTLRAVMLLAVALSAGSLFAQGRVFWQEGGVVVCDSTWAVGQAAVSDDSGGIAVVWRDSRGEYGSVWAQRVDRDGNVVWQRNGVLLRGENTLSPGQFSAVADGYGGLIAVWREGVLGSTRRQVTAQRVDVSGAVRWDSSGVVVTGADSGFDYEVAAVSDGRGGVVVAWTVAAFESTGVDSLVVQRIDSFGHPCWGNPGLVMATESVEISPAEMCSDGAGGVCIAWAFVHGYVWRSVAQHIDGAGQPTWPGAGVSLLTSSCAPVDAVPLSGGYMIACAFVDSIRAQRVDAEQYFRGHSKRFLVRGGTRS